MRSDLKKSKLHGNEKLYNIDIILFFIVFPVNGYTTIYDIQNISLDTPKTFQSIVMTIMSLDHLYEYMQKYEKFKVPYTDT